MSRNVTRQAFWGFACTILILIVLSYISFRVVNSLVLTEEERAHSFRLMTALQKVESELKDADTAQRGFLLTSDPKVLEPYKLSLANHKKNFETLHALTKDDATMKQSIARLEKLVQDKQEDMQQSIEMRGRVGFDAAVQIILSGKGNQIMDEIRAELTNLISRENQGLKLRDDRVRNEVRSAKVAMLFGTFAAVLVTVFAGFMITSTMREREFAAAQLRAAHQGLEEKVQERTAELEKANVLLKEEVEFRHSTEIALEKQRHFLRAVLDSLDEGIVACDATGNVTLVNHITHQILNLPEGELPSDPELWKEHYDVFEADGVTPLRAEATPLNRALTGESVKNNELIVAPHNSEKRIILATGHPIIDDRNDKLGAVVALRDISELKKSETARAAQQAAEASNRAKSEFLSRMSHELRTPLNAILGFAQLMQMDALPPDQMESVEQILKGGRHLLSLINEVLDISRIEAGRLAISLEPVLICEAVNEVVSLVSPIAAQRHVTIEFRDDAPHERFVRADRQRIKQVLMNLLSNAVKYNHESGWIRISAEESASGRLRVSVSDSGPGISPDRMHRLFTPFDRLDADHSDVEGTGLGLCLSKGLVELMGGTMGVESTVGQGSTFWFELNLTSAPQDTAGHLDVPDSAPPGPGVISNAKVLYIEDNVSNLRLVEQILKQRPGVTLIPAMEGRLGVELAAMHLPDLVFLDLNLPDISGVEVLRQLRANPVTQNIPVVVVSADATEGQIDKLLSAGAQNYLTKPINVAEFLREFDNITPASRLTT